MQHVASPGTSVSRRRRRGRFVTLELFIIDTFARIEDDGTEHPIDRPDELGGAGTYAIIGARIFLAPSELGMIIDHTPETFPLSMRETLESYGEDIFAFRLRTDGHPTSRAVNRYHGQTRGFDYLTKPLHLKTSSLSGTKFESPRPEFLHIVSYPDRTSQILDEVKQLQASSSEWAPILLWEPEPPCCVAENLEVFKQLVPQMDIFSPNHTEALSLLSMTAPERITLEAQREILADACRKLSRMNPKTATIIRASSLGCCYLPSLTSSAIAATVSAAANAEDQSSVRWVPAYWDPKDPASASRVVDPTGAGNAFMGGLGAALYEGKSMEEAILWGSVAASFTIEQDGLPRLTREADGEELWNGERPMDRVDRLRRRTSI